MTVFHGGQFKKAVFVNCPHDVLDDATCDAHVSTLFAKVGPMPPGLGLGAPIMGRNKKLQRVIRIPFYGVPFSIYNGTEYVASMERLYIVWIQRFMSIN